MTYPSQPIQRLETRRLLADFATLSAGTLTLSGTSGNDSFALLERSGKLRVIRSGVEIRFAANAVTRVIANLEAGDDSFVMNSALNLPVTVYGQTGNDTPTTGRGADRVEGNEGNDFISPGYGPDRTNGGTGQDVLSYRNDALPIRATMHPWARYSYFTETFTPQSDGDVRQGSDRDRHAEFELIEATALGDVLEYAPDGTSEAVMPVFTLLGAGGNDLLLTTGFGRPTDGPRAPVRLDAGDGNDVIRFGTGGETKSTVYGGAGDDVLTSQITYVSHDALVSGGRGIDTHNLGYVDGSDYFMPPDIENMTVTDFRQRSTPYAFHGNAQNNQMRIESEYASSADIYGMEGDDTIYGSKGKDTIHGDAGNDLIFADDADDRLYGGEGNDTIDGEAGRDFIYGGTGCDRGKKQSTDRVFDSIEGLV